MEKELLFAKQLQSLIELARLQENQVSEEQVKENFDSMDLTKEQYKLVYEYLKEHKVGVGESIQLDDYLSEDDHQYLDIYLEELSNLEVVTPGQKEAIILSSMAGDEDAQLKLIEVYLPQVVEVAKLYTGQGVFIEDLIGEGNVAITIGVSMLGCLESVSEADGLLGKMIMNAMEAYINDNIAANEEEYKIVKTINSVAEAAKELSEDLMRSVTIDELVRETKLTKKKIAEAIELSGGAIEYLEIDQMEEKNSI